MAKRKDAVALFEVITAAKKKEQAALGRTRAGSMLRTPKWWFKGKSKDGEQASPVDGDGAGVVHAAPALPAPNDPSAGYVPSATPGIVQRVSHVPAPERVTIPDQSDGTAAFGLDIPAGDHAAPARRGLGSWFGFGRVAKKVALDADRREVTVRFRYTTAIVAGFAVCVVVGLAYVTGRQANKANAGPGAVSSKAIKEGDILAGVLAISPNGEPTTGGDVEVIEAEDDDADVDSAPTDRLREQSKNGTSTKSTPIVKDAPKGKPATPRALPGGIEEGLPRANGLNYVIIQSYPDAKAANEAAEALRAAGIDCTVETAPRGWTADPDWKSVVGTLGFPPRPSKMPEYQRYIQQINKVSESYAGRSKMKRFEPSPYKWR